MPPVEMLKDPGAGGAFVFENRWNRFESYLTLLATVQLRLESAVKALVCGGKSSGSAMLRLKAVRTGASLAANTNSSWMG